MSSSIMVWILTGSKLFSFGNISIALGAALGLAFVPFLFLLVTRSIVHTCRLTILLLLGGFQGALAGGW